MNAFALLVRTAPSSIYLFHARYSYFIFYSSIYDNYVLFLFVIDTPM